MVGNAVCAKPIHVSGNRIYRTTCVTFSISTRNTRPRKNVSFKNTIKYCSNHFEAAEKWGNEWSNKWKFEMVFVFDTVQHSFITPSVLRTAKTIRASKWSSQFILCILCEWFEIRPGAALVRTLGTIECDMRCFSIFDIFLVLGKQQPEHSLREFRMFTLFTELNV